MKKLRFPCYIFCIFVNYILVLFAVLLYEQGGPVLYPIFLLTQPLLVLFNCIVSKNMRQFVIISLNLIASTIVANIVAIMLYMANICGGSETMLLLRYALVIDCAYVALLSIISFTVKTAIFKVFKYNR